MSQTNSSTTARASVWENMVASFNEATTNSSTLWSECRMMLTDPSAKYADLRKTVSRVASYIESAAIVGGVASGSVCVIASLIVKNVGLLALGTISYLIGRDISIISSNVERITTDSGAMNNLPTRYQAAISADLFVKACATGTILFLPPLQRLVTHELLRPR